jgi:predicted nucleic acid-binding protein
MKYLLDTDAFSDIVRGTPNVEARFSSVPPLKTPTPPAVCEHY